MRICLDKDRLLDRYCALVKAYSEAVAELRSKSGGEYDLGWVHAEELRAIAQGARLTLEQHELTHGCSSRTSTAPLAAAN